MLLRKFGRNGIESINWDEIRLRFSGAPAHSIWLDDPRRFGRDEMQYVAEFETATMVSRLPTQCPISRKEDANHE